MNSNNPFNALKPQPDYSNIKQAFQFARDPTRAFMGMAQQNPQLKSVMDMLGKGADPKGIFLSLCKERGIDPDGFIKSITQ